MFGGPGEEELEERCTCCDMGTKDTRRHFRHECEGSKPMRLMVHRHKAEALALGGNTMWSDNDRRVGGKIIRGRLRAPTCRLRAPTPVVTATGAHSPFGTMWVSMGAHINLHGDCT